MSVSAKSPSHIGQLFTLGLSITCVAFGYYLTSINDQYLSYDFYFYSGVVITLLGSLISAGLVFYVCCIAERIDDLITSKLKENGLKPESESRSYRKKLPDQQKKLETSEAENLLDEVSLILKEFELLAIKMDKCI